ncbi:MAG: GNAT family N-acetyltransferase [Oceanicaulis sp.]
MKDQIEAFAPPDAAQAITTDRLVLRPLEIADAGWVGRESGRPEVAGKLALVPSPNPALFAEMFILAARARALNAGDLVSAIVARETGAPLGVIGASARGEGRFGFGYWLAPSAWGKGYATEAGRAMVAALTARGARTLKAGWFTDNPASARVLEKLGFVHNGEDEPQFCTAALSKRPHRGMTLEIGPKTV